MPPEAVFHKINYVAPNSALKVATFSAAPAHYEYGPAVAPTLTKYNYAAAVPQQYQYAHYPHQTIQVYQHHHPHQAPAATATIITNAAGQLQYLHHPQQQAATIYTAHQPAAAVHYTLTQPAVQQSVGQQAQAGTIHYHHAHQPQHPQQTTFVGVQPSVPVVHQAPIAAINQVHQANQVIAAQAQLVKYPLPTASPIYATNAVQNHLYQQQSANYGSYAVPVAAKQYLSTVASPTVATPSHIKQLIPVTTATTTQHHGKGVSYSTFTQQANPASLGHQQNQSPYYNTVIAQQYQQQQQQQSQAQQQQQQPPAARFQVYSTLATPLQKPQVLYAAHQYAQPSIPAAIYATAASPFQQFQHQPQSSYPHYGSQFFHPQPPQHQQQLQPYAQLAKIAYNPGAASLQKGYYPVQ
ncbi:mediator of RNA polymerase II transcription subunit 15-like [Aedes aegypti]|uniref:Uncharacterized protein n=1 Tax=Aedes aegypti TaxID=7159 RepID=A0A6I8TZH8_AEDAE|nr:mediator of RNA polymerase II transcription subunit 15-like [Aedes aegypti]